MKTQKQINVCVVEKKGVSAVDKWEVLSVWEGFAKDLIGQINYFGVGLKNP